MACPHVAGAPALLVESQPTLSPGKIKELLLAQASSGRVEDPGQGSPNRLLHVRQAPVCSKLVHVRSHVPADKGFWNKQCSFRLGLNMPGTGAMIRVDMGTVKDYFRPRSTWVSLCEMQ